MHLQVICQSKAKELTHIASKKSLWAMYFNYPNYKNLKYVINLSLKVKKSKRKIVIKNNPFFSDI